MAVWESVTTGLGHGGYVAWEKAVAEARGDGGRIHLPGFLALQPPASNAAAGENLCALTGGLDPALPLAAVIDDGIGFLNARFRRGRRYGLQPGAGRIRDQRPSGGGR
ncbi:MAG: hypothetical protein C0524_14610 [Rhodobacter sp.]|nr:hypothetical protein [Rhodobacter sp.]